MVEVIRCEDEQKHGLYHRNIFGLNLFSYNDVACPTERRPDVLFLKRLTEQVTCSAQVSAMALKDIVDAPEEIFGPPDGATPYRYSVVGYYDGFYNLGDGADFSCPPTDGLGVNDRRRYGDCFFPQVTPAFWQAFRRDEGALEDLLYNHGMVLYVAPTGADVAREMELRIRAPFAGEATWLQAVAHLYSLVLLVGHDGQYYHGYSRDAAQFGLLEHALSDAVATVLASDWFAANQANLAWDGDHCACLMLPE